MDEAFLDVVTAIKAALKLRGSRPHVQEKRARGSVPSRVPIIRSSNLRVKKEFSDYDKDKFRREGFEYLANFFENSINELVRRNPDLNQEFRRIDANRFTAVIYKGGKKVCRCIVYLGGMLNGIAFSRDEDARSNSFNESLSVEVDQESIFFKAIGMSMLVERDKKLSFEGAAEAYWALFLEPIQPRR
ncbi:MAG TPA: hypothetical protein VE422_23255 [Terriglobia bacterium]|nr:hypothetical protein [Terriglobia bacterium]